MSTGTDVVDGQLVTWEQYEALGDDVRCEYIDGRIVMSPTPTRRHHTIARRLANVLEPVLPAGWAVTEAWAWKPTADEFAPDVMVHPDNDEDVRLTGVPQLVVEILSSHRQRDQVLKLAKYAAAGAPHYWIVDPRDRRAGRVPADPGRAVPAGPPAHRRRGRRARPRDRDRFPGPRGPARLTVPSLA